MKSRKKSPRYWFRKLGGQRFRRILQDTLKGHEKNDHREHLKEIAFYYPGVWFKADLIHGGVTIRLFKKDHGHEFMLARTVQSDKLLAAVTRPDFRKRLRDELIYQGFPLEKAKE